MAYIGKIPDLIHPTTGQSTSEDIFTATANQTVFTLTADVSAETDIIAAINGVVQSGTAYAVSGTGNRTLTFTAGLTVGDQLRVLHIGFKPATNFVPDNSVTTVKINADAVTGAKIADNAVGNEHLEDDTVGVAELSATGTASNTTFLRGDNSWQTVTSYTHPNHSGEVTSTADGAQVVVDNVIDEANLKVSNSPTNGQFLSAQSGNTGGLTWAEAGSTSASDLTSGTLPMARLSGTLPALNGSALTNLDAADVSGTHTNFTSTGIDDNADAACIKIDSSENVGICLGGSDTALGKLHIRHAVDPGTVASALHISFPGAGGGTATPHYGIKIDSSASYNNTTTVYGVHAIASQNTGRESYGLWGETNPGNSTTQRHGVHGLSNFNSAASFDYATMPTGVYAEVLNSAGGTSNTSRSTAAHFKNRSTYGSESYGAYIETTAGPTTIVPLLVRHGGTANSNDRLRVDSSGAVTTPSQPSFLACLTSTASNVTGAGTQYNTQSKTFTEVYDIGSNFSSGTFTAPVTGKYILYGSFYFTNTNTNHNQTIIYFTTSNRTYNAHRSHGNNIYPYQGNFTHSVVADMDASDTFYMSVNMYGHSSNTVHVNGGSTAQNGTFMGAALIG